VVLGQSGISQHSIGSNVTEKYPQTLSFFVQLGQIQSRVSFEREAERWAPRDPTNSPWQGAGPWSMAWIIRFRQSMLCGGYKHGKLSSHSSLLLGDPSLSFSLPFLRPLKSHAFIQGLSCPEDNI
jgi:hypothetical protein